MEGAILQNQLKADGLAKAQLGGEGVLRGASGGKMQASGSKSNYITCVAEVLLLAQSES